MNNGTERQASELSPLDAYALAEAGGGVVIDVREFWEWQDGHASGATHIPLNSLPARIDELPSEQAVLLICASGNRSMRAAQYLAGLGYDARSIAGGTTAWGLHQLPLEAGVSGVAGVTH